MYANDNGSMPTVLNRLCRAVGLAAYYVGIPVSALAEPIAKMDNLAAGVVSGLALAATATYFTQKVSPEEIRQWFKDSRAGDDSYLRPVKALAKMAGYTAFYVGIPAAVLVPSFAAIVYSEGYGGPDGLFVLGVFGAMGGGSLAVSAVLAVEPSEVRDLGTRIKNRLWGPSAT
jgi:hypothetical protein